MQLHHIIPHYKNLADLKSFLPGLLSELAKSPQHITLTIVDDGSPAEAQKDLTAFLDPLGTEFPLMNEPILMKMNRGKGYAIRTGWASKPEADLLSFSDADDSIKADEVVQFLEASFSHPDQATCATRSVVSRKNRSVKRRIAAYLFSRIADRMLSLHLHDPQCGLKVIPGKAYREIEKQLCVDRFAFDCELLTFLESIGVQIEQREVHWEAAASSTVRIFRDGYRMMNDIWKLSNRMKQSIRQHR